MGDTPRAEQLSAYGLGLARDGHLRAAAHLLEMASDVRPDPQLTALAVSFLLDAGDPQGARDQLEAEARAHGWDSPTRYLRIVAAARSGQVEDAIEFALELAGDPDRGVDAQLLLVDLLLKKADVEGARSAADAALRERPDSTDGLLARARVAQREGMREEQLALLKRARTLDPDNLAVRTAHGIALLDTDSRAEGQRELAWVLARRPGDPVATHALLGSSVRSSKGRLAFLAAFFLIPGICVLGAWLAATIQGMPAPRWLSSVYVYSLIAVVIAARTLERLRTDRSVRVIKKDAHRALIRANALFPTLRPLRWLLVAILSGLWILFVLTALIFTQASVAWRAATFLLAIPGWLVLVAAVGLWKRRRGQITRGEPRRFDASSCQCHRISSVSGQRADAYLQRHLTFELSIDQKGIDQHRCNLLGIRWLRFSEKSGLREELFPVALRLPDTFLPPREGAIESQRTGFYL